MSNIRHRQAWITSIVVCLAAVVSACGSAQTIGAGGDEPIPATTVSDQVPNGPPVPPPREGDIDFDWGAVPEGEQEIKPSLSSQTAFGSEVAAAAGLKYNPVVVPISDVSPRVYSPPREINSGEQVEMIYASAKYGWFGVWANRAAEGEESRFVKTQLALCEQPLTECLPAKPQSIKLDNGLDAIMRDPGGVIWIQDGVKYELAGPWADFPSTRSLELANSLSAEIAALKPPA